MLLFVDLDPYVATRNQEQLLFLLLMLRMILFKMRKTFQS